MFKSLKNWLFGRKNTGRNRRADVYLGPYTHLWPRLAEPELPNEDEQEAEAAKDRLQPEQGDAKKPESD